MVEVAAASAGRVGARRGRSGPWVEPGFSPAVVGVGEVDAPREGAAEPRWTAAGAAAGAAGPKVTAAAREGAPSMAAARAARTAAPAPVAAEAAAPREAGS